jgi:uncharacterized delta-60 repeat protein
VALAGSGGLDPSFGTGGATILERRVSTWPTPAAPSPGEKLVAVTSPSNGTVVVSRFLPDGAPDPSFGSGGQVVIKTEGTNSGHGVAVASDGKIVIVGISDTAGGEEVTVWRLTVSGALDPTFGDSATGTTQIDTGTLNFPNAVAIQPDGKIVVAGTIQTSPAPQKVGVWRLTGAVPPTRNSARRALSKSATAKKTRPTRSRWRRKERSLSPEQASLQPIRETPWRGD